MFLVIPSSLWFRLWHFQKKKSWNCVMYFSCWILIRVISFTCLFSFILCFCLCLFSFILCLCLGLFSFILCSCLCLLFVYFMFMLMFAFRLFYIFAYVCFSSSEQTLKLLIGNSFNMLRALEQQICWQNSYNQINYVIIVLLNCFD